LNVFVDDPEKSALTINVYGADLLGNIFRFSAADNFAATLVGTLKDSGGTPLPITTVVQTAEVNGKIQLMVATGRLLGVSDIGSTQTNSVFVMFDKVGTNPVYTNPRTDLTKITLTQTGSGDSRVVEATCNGTAAQCTPTNGWYADFPISGERNIIDVQQANGVLFVATSLLDNNPCNAGGTGQLYKFSTFTGLAPDAPTITPPGTTTTVSTKPISGLPVGITLRNLTGGRLDVRITTSQPSLGEVPGGSGLIPQPPQGNRVTWREITE
jgi:type IV pilus assembly protein PilY1